MSRRSPSKISGKSDAVFDFEPEDAWHPDDTKVEQARNLARRIALVDAQPIAHDPRVPVLLEIVARRARRASARDDLSPRDRLRLAQLFDDLEFVRGRL